MKLPKKLLRLWREPDMSILVNQNTRLLVQGITGKEGLFHTQQMVQYGTNVVAGVPLEKVVIGCWMEKSRL